MKTNFKTIVFAGVCLITATLTGCAQQGTERAPGQNDGLQNQGYGGNNLVNATPQLRQGNMTGINNQGANLGMNGNNQQTPNRQKAEDIKRQLMMMNGVDDANVIVMGNTALIGIRTRNNTGNNGITGNAGNTGNRVNLGNAANMGDMGNTGNTALRSRIESKVKEIDNTITNVTVSESPDIMNRMNRLGTNTSTDTFTDEFNKLIQGITPGR